MPTPHASVNYVEPNLFIGQSSKLGEFDQFNWALDDGYERAPRLEDYCIVVNIDVEVSSREQETVEGKDKHKFLRMTWRTQPNDNNQEKNTDEPSRSTVNFMGGTKVMCGDKRYMTYLTTNYADMYVEDLVDYGTTEMIGIKSIDIKYEKSCVPIVTIQFTDVRGMSLFQPTELSRGKSYNSITQLNADNVAQSFFQCFLTLPIPKFTIYIKGFYGRPVSYQVACDKFETRFNAQTGDFDITTRFIGYSYSFLTDISIDALLAAPYSDYGGKAYWEQKRNDGTFVLWNKEKSMQKPMPTLFEAYMEIQQLLASGNSLTQSTSVESEGMNHEEEISRLTELRQMYQSWYETLYNICKERYGKKYCYKFQNGGENGDYYGILILANAQTVKNGMAEEYKQFPDTFKKTQDDLYAAVEAYNNANNASQKLENVSKDFSGYTRQHLFNNMYVDSTRNIVFNGFSSDNSLSETDVRNNLFVSKAKANTEEDRKKNNELQKEYVLHAIYNDGVDQYVDCFFLGPNYSQIKARLDALQNESNKSAVEKEQDKKIKELNDAIFANMSWYPSIENFTRMMMAHFETLMHMMYTLVGNVSGRTASDLGITVGKDGTASDLKTSVENVPPFPRVTEDVVGDDNIVKKEDVWVGDLNNGCGFEEAQMVDGLFNAIEEIEAIIKENQNAVNEIIREQSNAEGQAQTVVKRALCPSDFFMTYSPYGESSEIANDLSCKQFAAKVAVRMFNLLNINYFRKEMGQDKWLGWAKNIGETEAKNFYDLVTIPNRDFLVKLNSEGLITPQFVIDTVTKADASNPWGKQALFSSDKNNMWLDGYRVDKKNQWLYPVKNYNIGGMKTTLKAFQDGTEMPYNGQITASNLINEWKWSLLNNNECDFMTTKIVEGSGIKSIQAIVDTCSQDSDDAYSPINQIISAEFNYLNVEDPYFNMNPNYKSFVEKPAIKSSNTTFNIVNGTTIVYWKKNNHVEGSEMSFTTPNNYIQEAANSNITLSCICELYGFKRVNGKWVYDLNSNFTQSCVENKDDLYGTPIKIGNETVSWRVVAFYVMSIYALDYNKLLEMLNSAKAALWVPRLAALQIGAVIIAQKQYTDVNVALPLPPSFDVLFSYINNLTPMAKMAYAKSFIKFVKEMRGKIVDDLTNWEGANSKSIYCGAFRKSRRRILNWDSNYVKAMTNNAMQLVCIVRLNVNHFANQSRGSYATSQGVATTYLTAFINKLKELYGGNSGGTEGSGSTPTTVTKAPTMTTKDMKKELYRYLKQLHDKWIPTSSFDNWTMESFFDKKSEEAGHTFYFIDSFYNDIGHKLLINPQQMKEKIDALLGYQDINTMMLGFMADMYAQNRCMFLCLQNFYDLSKKGSMNDMFVPYTYNDVPFPNEYPSFVVVYPYEPSKNLDVGANSEYEDDSFMLNDETETPKAVTSRDVNEDTYMIPAFGVTYGRQYQSFFKNVNVDMTNPIATQQSIKAKHYIIRNSQNNVSKNSMAQDLYDIYSTQSYTCTVEMMGCPWVQPMMYFVLLNIPMFRGSYMIMRVTHKITQGNMVTEFTGCRMCNVANTLIQNIFLGEDSFGGSTSSEEDVRNQLADVDNDCPYKVYPLFSNGNYDINSLVTGKAMTVEQGKDIANAMHSALVDMGWKDNAAWGIVGNIYQECAFNPYIINTTYKNSKGVIDYGGGLAGWYPNYHLFMDMYMNLYETYGSWSGGNETGLSNRSDTIRLIKERDFEYQLTFLSNSVQKNKNKKRWASGPFKPLLEDNNLSIEEAARIWYLWYGCNGTPLDSSLSKRIDYAKKFASMASSAAPPKERGSQDANNDIKEAFFNAVQKSASSTPSVNVELKKSEREGFPDLIIISQDNGKNDKIGKVFDIILNGYYDYVQCMVAVFDKNKLSEEMSKIIVYPRESVEPNKRSINVVEGNVHLKYDGKNSYSIPSLVSFTAQDKDNISLTLRKALYKKYKEKNKEIPQFTDDGIFEGLSIENCGNLVAKNSGYGQGASPNSSWAQTVIETKKFFCDDPNGPQGYYSQKVVMDWSAAGFKIRPDCSGFVSACLQKFGAIKSPMGSGLIATTNDLASKGFQKINYSFDAVQPWDIVAYNGHTEIVESKGSTPNDVMVYNYGNPNKEKNRKNPRGGDPDKYRIPRYTTIWRYIGNA